MKNLNNPVSIKYWPADDRPREKMILKGPAALSNSELIAILINNGNKEKSALMIAMEVLKLGNDNLGELGKLSIKDLQKIKGIGEAKAISISAALELGRRRLSLSSQEKTVVKSSREIAEYLKLTLQDHNHEVFAIIFLNRANKIKHFEIISKGG